MRIELQRPVEKPGTALKLLQNPQLDDTQLRSCFRHGAVWLDDGSAVKRVYRPEQQVEPGQTLYLYCNDTTLTACPQQARLIEDFETFSIWFKPAGMLSQGSKWGDHWTLHQWIKAHRFPQRECLITHRLDRYTSGLMMVAHDAQTNQRLHRAFEKRQVRKTYRAVVNGLLPVGSVDTLDSAIDGRSAFTAFEVLAQDPKTDSSLLQLTPLTGRKHQIRIHLAELGFPVRNDRQYGREPFTGDLCLQACALDFLHPDHAQPVSLRLDPADLLEL